MFHKWIWTCSNTFRCQGAFPFFLHFKFRILTGSCSCVEQAADLKAAMLSLKSNVSLLSVQSPVHPGISGLPSSPSLPMMHLSPPPPPAHYAPGMSASMIFAAPAPPRAHGGGGALDKASLPSVQSCSLRMSSLSSEQVARISKKCSPSPSTPFSK